MSRIVLSIITALAFSVGIAVAQSAGSAGAQGTQSGSPSNQGSSSGGSEGRMGRPDSNNPNMGQDQNNPSGTTNNTMKGEKKLKGCVQSQGGQAMLQTRKGKDITLTGQDVSAHNGHEVEIKGTWEKSDSAGMSQSSAGATGERTFNVTDVKMISDTCSGHEKGSSMERTPGASNSTGSTTGQSGSGNSTGSPGTTQPQ